MKRLFLSLIAALLIGCATVKPSAQVDLALTTVDAYVDVMAQSYARGRITKAQALKAADNADKALKVIAEARTALACTKAPCGDFAGIMQGLRPNLLELERELRKQQEAGK